tara:strand:+ start:38 stop:520 length:483 start_codon:yes stop_codon:yes gene_type:complete
MKFSNPRNNNNNNNRPFKRSNNHHRRQGESSNSGPRVSGNLTTVLEKYKNLAKEATSSGDYVAAENYFQHAEHFVRVLNERNVRNNNESKSTTVSNNTTSDSSESVEKSKDTVSEEPIDIVKVLKPIPMEVNSDSEDVSDLKEVTPVKKKVVKKTATVKK